MSDEESLNTSLPSDATQLTEDPNWANQTQVFVGGKTIPKSALKDLGLQLARDPSHRAATAGIRNARLTTLSQRQAKQPDTAPRSLKLDGETFYKPNSYLAPHRTMDLANSAVFKPTYLKFCEKMSKLEAKLVNRSDLTDDQKARRQADMRRDMTLVDDFVIKTDRRHMLSETDKNTGMSAVADRLIGEVVRAWEKGGPHKMAMSRKRWGKPPPSVAETPYDRLTSLANYFRDDSKDPTGLKTALYAAKGTSGWAAIQSMSPAFLEIVAIPDRAATAEAHYRDLATFIEANKALLSVDPKRNLTSMQRQAVERASAMMLLRRMDPKTMSGIRDSIVERFEEANANVAAAKRDHEDAKDRFEDHLAETYGRGDANPRPDQEFAARMTETKNSVARARNERRNVQTVTSNLMRALEVPDYDELNIVALVKSDIEESRDPSASLRKVGMV